MKSSINQPLYVDVGNGVFMMLGLPTLSLWDTKNRPKNAKPGTLGFNFQTNSLEYWSGDNWFTAAMRPAKPTKLT